MVLKALKMPGRSALLHQFGGFLAVGALNTVITLLVYEGALLILHYGWAYAISVLVGFIYSLLANSKWVFRSGLTVKRTLLYSVTTAVNLLLGLLVLHLLISELGFPDALAPLAVIVLMLPINFLLSRFALSSAWLARRP